MSDIQPDPYLDPIAIEDDPPEYDPDDAEAQRIAERAPTPAPNTTAPKPGRG